MTLICTFINQQQIHTETARNIARTMHFVSKHIMD